MTGLLIGFFALLAGVLAGYIFVGLYPNPWFKPYKELESRIAALERVKLKEG